MIVLLALSYWVVSREATTNNNPPEGDSPGSGGIASTGAGYWTLIFAYYCLLIHLLVFAFPLRACWSIWDISRRLQISIGHKAPCKAGLYNYRRDSSNSLSSSDTLALSSGSSLSSSSSDTGDIDQMYSDNSSGKVEQLVVHAIVIPNYKEEIDTLRESLEVLASHPMARDWYDVSLLVVH